MKSKITINDLKDDELRIILKLLSVRQLFNCLTVSKRFQSIIIEILESQKVLTLLYNDINHYTKQELEVMCSQRSHIGINSSVGRIIGSKAMISPFILLEFSHIRDKFPHIIDFCPNIQSLNLKEFSIKNSDIELILKLCPKLECLSITSNDKNWRNILLNSISGLKHVSLSLTYDAVFGSKPHVKCRDLPLIEELIIDGADTDSLIEDILCSLLKSISSQINKFHFRPSNQIFNEKVLDIIKALNGDEVNKSHIKNLDIDVIAFDEMIESINSQLSSLEILYLHFNSQSKQSISMKNLKNLREIHLIFNSNNDFGFRSVSNDENSVQFISLLLNIPSNVKKLSISNAFIALSTFRETSYCLPFLQQLELNYVCIETDSVHNFWQVIANFKNLKSLTLNLTDITDNGCEHLIECQSLQSLELVKYKGPKAGETLISSLKMIETFKKLAKREINVNKWFDLRLDIDVFEVNDEIKSQIPRNMRLMNVGFKK